MTTRRNIRHCGLQEEVQLLARQEAIGRFAREYVDILNNTLTAIWGNIALAKRFLDPSESAYERLQQAEQASSRAKEIIRSLQPFPPCREPIRERLDMALLLQETAVLVLHGSGIRFRAAFGQAQILVDADRLQMRQVLHALVVVGRTALPSGGTIEADFEWLDVDAGHPIFQEGTCVAITLCIQGVCLTEGERSRMLEPFFASTPGEGSIGIGGCLAEPYGLVRKHGGLLTIGSQPDGVGITLYLPAPQGSWSKKKSGAEPARPAPPPAASGHAHPVVSRP